MKKIYTIKKIHLKGEINFYGEKIKQNRYIVLNFNEIDEIGEHFDFKQATQIKNELNKF